MNQAACGNGVLDCEKRASKRQSSGNKSSVCRGMLNIAQFKDVASADEVMPTVVWDVKV